MDLTSNLAPREKLRVDIGVRHSGLHGTDEFIKLPRRDSLRLRPDDVGRLDDSCDHTLLRAWIGVATTAQESRHATVHVFLTQVNVGEQNGGFQVIELQPVRDHFVGSVDPRPESSTGFGGHRGHLVVANEPSVERVLTFAAAIAGGLQANKRQQGQERNRNRYRQLLHSSLPSSRARASKTGASTFRDLADPFTPLPLSGVYREHYRIRWCIGSVSY